MADSEFILTAAQIAANAVFAGGTVGGVAIPAMSVNDIQEMDGSPTEDVTENGLEATITIRCPFAYRMAILEMLLFTEYPYGGNCFLTTARFRQTGERLQGVGQRNYYEHCLIDLVYKQLNMQKFRPSDNKNWADEEEKTKELETEFTDVLSENITTSAEAIILDHNKFKWTDSSGEALTADEAPGKIRPILEYSQTRFNVATIPAEVFTLAGYCNQASFKAPVLKKTFQAEEVLFLGADIERTLQVGISAGLVAAGPVNGWNVTLKFAYKFGGWNKYYRAKTDDYEFIWNISDAAIHRSYPMSNSLPLIKHPV